MLLCVFMVDPILSLAVSMHNNKGVYALLLGSGVSRSSGILTGWDIVQDLIRQLAHLKQEVCEPDPDTWFRQTFGIEPEYSEVLNQIAKSPAERGQVLRRYFEPTEEDREEGRKQPTTAHRSIAELVAKGYVRVIVTTNFDRLLEQALADVGTQATVVSSPDAVQGVLPLAHSRCTLIKINGDYLDTRLKNTRGELEQYDEGMERLLDQVFDEYGLIICGWSADWDTALRSALERCSNHRFTTYWTMHGSPSAKAENVVTLRRAAKITITDADAFFREVAEKVAALESFAATDPLNASVAVARLKKYLKSDSYEINLRDLLATETERVYKAIAGSSFPVDTPANLINGQTILARMHQYEAELHVLLPLVICAAYWGEAKHDHVILGCLKRIADQYGPDSGKIVWLKLKRYPALLLLHGMGLGAIANGKYRFLRALFSLNIRTDKYKVEQAAAITVHDHVVLEKDTQKLLPGREREYTPLPNHLFSALREHLREYLPDDNHYDSTFDWFQYLFCLVHCDLQITRPELADKKAKDPDFILWAPAGRFLWKTSYGDEGGIEQRTELRKGQAYPATVAAVLRAGFFESGGQLQEDKYIEVKAAFDRLVVRIRHQLGIG